MSRKTQFRALIGLVEVVAIVVGVLVWPEPKEALATDHAVKLIVTSWGWPIEPYDLSPTARFLNSSMQQVGDSFDLDMFIDESHYQGIYPDIPSSAYYVEIDWIGGGWDWGFEGEAFSDSPVVVLVEWSGTTTVQVWCSWNGR